MRWTRICARCIYSGSNSQFDAQTAKAIWSFVHLYCPRSKCRSVYVRPYCYHVFRPNCRDGWCNNPVSESFTSVHAGAIIRRSDSSIWCEEGTHYIDWWCSITNESAYWLRISPQMQQMYGYLQNKKTNTSRSWRELLCSMSSVWWTDINAAYGKLWKAFNEVEYSILNQWWR